MSERTFFTGVRRAPHWLAASTAVFFVALGASVALGGASCSPSTAAVDAGDDAPVCNPDSGDPAGCACDPSTTKPATCYTGPAGTNGKGFCQTGTRSCTPQGTFTRCEGEVTPQPEVCDLADNDCDGIIDDLPEIADAAVIARCNSPACENSGVPDAAITCWGPDPGICGAGVKSCAPGPKGGTPTGCNEFVHTPAQEVCNGIDDDCNGTIDDGLDQEGPCDMPEGSTWAADANPLEAGPDGAVQQEILGECVHGNLTCVASNCDDHSCKDAGDQCFPSQPITELCNGKDDDCNGKIDDHSCATPSDIQNGFTYCCVYNPYPTDVFCDSNLQTQYPTLYTCSYAGN